MGSGGSSSSSGRRGSAGRGSRDNEKVILDHGPIRIKYSQFKNEYYGADSIRDTYDAATKTIEVAISPVTKKLMQDMPESELKEFMSAYPGASKYQAMTNGANMILDQVRSGEAPLASDPKWYKEAYKIAQAEERFLRLHGYYNRKTGKFVKQR